MELIRSASISMLYSKRSGSDLWTASATNRHWLYDARFDHSIFRTGYPFAFGPARQMKFLTAVAAIRSKRKIRALCSGKRVLYG